MRWLLGIEIMNLTASVKYFSIPKLGTLGYNAFVNYQFEKDVIGCLQTSGAVTHAASTSILEVIGSNTYSVKATWNNELALFLDDPDKTEWRLKGTEAYKVWGHMQMDEYFLECVARGIKPSITPEDGRKAVEVACKIVGKE
jgi:predicted dehydrogenase